MTIVIYDRSHVKPIAGSLLSHGKVTVVSAGACVTTALRVAGASVDEKSLALIGNPRRAMQRSSRHLYSRGFSITRLEGRRWAFAADAGSYGESTGKRVEVVVRGKVPDNGTRTAVGDGSRFQREILELRR